MATYRVKLDDGRVLRVNVEGNTPPTEEDILQYINSNQNNSQVENTSEDNKNVSSPDSNVFAESLKRNLAEIAYGGLKNLSGRTFGATDFGLKKIGLDPTPLYNYVESQTPYSKALGIGAELLGNIKSGSKILEKTLKGGEIFGKQIKGVEALEKLAAAENATKGTKQLAKIARVGYLPATGALEGALIGGFGTESLDGAAGGAAIGALTSGAIGAVGAGLRNVFSAADVAPKMKQGFPNAVKDPKTTQVLNTSVGANPTVAETAFSRADDAKRMLNKEVVDDIEKVYGKANYEEGVKQAKANFKAHMNEMQNQQVFDMDDNVKYIASTSLKKAKKQSATPKNPQTQKNAPKTKYLADELGFEKGQLSHRQEQVLKRLWDDAREAATSRAAGRQGDYGHVQRVIQDLNGMIRNSKKPQPTSAAGEPQVTTAELTDLRNKILGLKKMQQNPHNAEYARTMRLQDAYDDGLQHTPNSIKRPDIQSPEEQLAFERGVMDRVKMNPATTNVASKGLDVADVLVNSKVPNANNLLATFRNYNNYYRNAESLKKKAYNKLWGGTVDQAIPTGTSVTKMAIDTAQDILTGRKYRKLGKYIFDPERKIAPLNIIRYYNLGQQSTNALIDALSEKGE